MTEDRICIIGRGNVAIRFGEIFGVTPLSSRSMENVPANADLYLIAVSDDAVGDVAKKLPNVKGIVAHTTGSVSMDVFEGKNFGGYGVFYPLQTLSKQRSLKAADIPILIEGNDEKTRTRLHEIAREYGFSSSINANGKMRGKAHLAATFACNFTNALIGCGTEILERSNIDPKILMPLISETIAKLGLLHPQDAQTGPARRGDTATMKHHEDLLQTMGMTEEKRIYEEISALIRRNSQN